MRPTCSQQAAPAGNANRFWRNSSGSGSRGRAAAAVFGAGSLTGREHQVVALAVEGLTARAIDQWRHIGEPTVETHLDHAYAKLGVTPRWERTRSAPIRHHDIIGTVNA
jgi:DNA-binding CsgD family transcriptional regulator